MRFRWRRTGIFAEIISKFDFLRAFAFTTGQVVPHYNELMSRPASEVMTEAVVHVDQTSPLTRVLQLMVSLKTRSFPVISADGHLVGMISREDVMRALEETTQENPDRSKRTRRAPGESTLRCAKARQRAKGSW